MEVYQVILLIFFGTSLIGNFLIHYYVIRDFKVRKFLSYKERSKWRFLIHFVPLGSVFYVRKLILSNFES